MNALTLMRGSRAGLRIAALVLISLLAWGGMPGAAQDITATPSPSPTPTATLTPLTVTTVEPLTLIAGDGGTISVLGSGFSSGAVVRLVGFGVLTTTVIGSGALTALVPAAAPAGSYTLEVLDPLQGSAFAPAPLTLLAPTVLPTAIFTLAPPLPEPTLLPTSPPPTVAPGQPNLIVRSFVASPSPASPGGAVELRFEVVNQGDRAALGVSVALDPSDRFAPAPGQSSATLADIPVGGAAAVVLNVITGEAVVAGANALPLTLRYRDFEGKTYESKASLSVTIVRPVEAPRLALARAVVSPASAPPGGDVTVEITLTNYGSRAAEGVQVQFVAADGALLPGSQGDLFTIGTLPVGGTVTVRAPMIIRPLSGDNAAYGPRTQPLRLTWIEDTTAKELTTAITITVSAPDPTDPLLLLDAYTAEPNEDGVLRPGQRFTLSLSLRNVGTGSAADMLVTFGTVSGGESGGTPPPGGGSSTTAGSSAFAPLGTGSTLFRKALEADESTSFTQEFIVSGAAASGIYPQPITVRYRTPGGSVRTDTLTLSLIVVAAPRVQTTFDPASDDPVFVEQGLPLTLTVENTGTRVIEFTTASITAVNGEVLDGAQSQIGPLAANNDATLVTTIVPSAEGAVTVTFALGYRDELNTLRTLTVERTLQAIAAPTEPEIPFEPEPTPTIEPTPSPSDDLVARLLMGFLGLGS